MNLGDVLLGYENSDDCGCGCDCDCDCDSRGDCYCDCDSSGDCYGDCEFDSSDDINETIQHDTLLQFVCSSSIDP